MEQEEFDFEAFMRDAKEKLKQKQPMSGKDGIFQPLIKHMLEEMLNSEANQYLDEYQRSKGNRLNGKSRKQVKSTSGAFELETPRDRDSTFEPKVVSKRQIVLNEDLEQRVLNLYSIGMSTRDISRNIEELYGFTMSPTSLSSITDKVIPLVKEWQQRPLERVYSFVWLDAIHYKVKEDGQVTSRAIYNIIGIDTKGQKDLLGMYVSESESARFWLQVLNDLRSRGVEDILIASIDNLNGFKEAISNIYPKTDIQLCIIHQIRNTMKYLAWKDSREFLKNIRTVYQASTKEEAEYNLDLVEQKWGKKYSIIFKSWRNNWENLSSFFKYPSEIRKIMYTTNIIEGFHRQVRKVTKTKGAFTSDIALLKLIYLATQRIVEKWRGRILNWGIIASQLSIIFGERANIEINSI
jgi:transposase-like protein